VVNLLRAAAFLALAFRGPFSSELFSQPTPMSSTSMSLFSTNPTLHQPDAIPKSLGFKIENYLAMSDPTS
jgi:hypothetical protein